MANQEADRLAAEERRLLERELASLQSHLVAVNYEGSKLDAARLRRQYPLHGNQNGLAVVNGGRIGQGQSEHDESKKTQG